MTIDYIFKNYNTFSINDKKEANKILLKEYPFLDINYGNPIDKFTYTWLDDMPNGWRISFGKLLMDELKDELNKFNFIDDYKITDIKEKYGSLRIYDAGIPKDSNVWNIIEKYSTLSENICIVCGKPDVPMVMDSWISPFCEDCWNKQEEKYLEHNKSYKELTSEHCKMQDYLEYVKYDNTGKTTFRIDISDTTNLIRSLWNN